MIRLCDLKAGESFIVKEIRSGYRAKTRLTNLGILPDIKVEIVSVFKGSPIHIKTENRGNYVIGKGLAKKIYGEKID